MSIKDNDAWLKWQQVSVWVSPEDLSFSAVACTGWVRSVMRPSVGRDEQICRVRNHKFGLEPHQTGVQLFYQWSLLQQVLYQNQQLQLCVVLFAHLEKDTISNLGKRKNRPVGSSFYCRKKQGLHLVFVDYLLLLCMLTWALMSKLHCLGFLSTAI